MYFRRLPNTDIRRLASLEKAYQKAFVSEEPGQAVLSEQTGKRLRTVYPVFRDLLDRRNYLTDGQTEATSAKKEAFSVLKMTVSHFFQVLNFGIMRGEFQMEDRLYFGIESVQGSLPSLTRENDLITYGTQIVAGEKDRRKKGLKPVANPDASDVEKALLAFEKASDNQKKLLEEQQKLASEIEQIRPDTDDLILDVWDEVDFHFRKIQADRKRDEASVFGVFYEKR